jgi:hypothetical protein
MILPNHFSQAFGPETVGQGARRFIGKATGLEQVGHAAL